MCPWAFGVMVSGRLSICPSGRPALRPSVSGSSRWDLGGKQKDTNEHLDRRLDQVDLGSLHSFRIFTHLKWWLIIFNSTNTISWILCCCCFFTASCMFEIQRSTTPSHFADMLLGTFVAPFQQVISVKVFVQVWINMDADCNLIGWQKCTRW